jgi:predicted CoA-binding protein
MSANPTPDQIRSLLREVKTIAVVGLSPRAERPSYRVSRAMQGFGYRIVPVRPAVTEVLGEKAYARLSDIPFPVDLVDVFRNADEVGPIVDECIALGVKRLWLQDGVVNEEAAERPARRASPW